MSDFKEKLAAAKESQKELAETIRAKRREGDRAHYDSYRFRHAHLAYCLIRGRSLRQIENKNREGNKPNRGEILRWIERLFGEEVHDYAKPFVLSNEDDIRIPRPSVEGEHDEEALRAHTA